MVIKVPSRFNILILRSILSTYILSFQGQIEEEKSHFLVLKFNSATKTEEGKLHLLSHLWNKWVDGAFINSISDQSPSLQL